MTKIILSRWTESSFTEIKELQNFKIECKSCNSTNCELIIDWDVFQDGGYNTIALDCKDCKKTEICYDEQL